MKKKMIIIIVAFIVIIILAVLIYSYVSKQGKQTTTTSTTTTTSGSPGLLGSLGSLGNIGNWFGANNSGATPYCQQHPDDPSCSGPGGLNTDATGTPYGDFCAMYPNDAICNMG